MSRAFRADKQKCFPPDGHRSHAAFGIIVRCLQVPGPGEVRQGVPVLQGIVHGDTERILGQHRVHSIVEPGFELGEQRNALRLPFAQAFLIAKILDLSLDAEYLFVIRQRLMRPAWGLEQVCCLHELTARVNIAGHFCDFPGEEQWVVAGIGIGLQEASVVGVAEKNWPQAQVALQAVIEDKNFQNLPEDIQFKTLQLAGQVALEHGQVKRGYDYFVRVTSFPQTGYKDWRNRLVAADGVGDLPDIEPSESWRDLTLLLLEKGWLTKANDVATHVTDVYVLIAMRVDRRFDAVVAANPAQFDITASADRDFLAFQAAAEKTPHSLELKSHVIQALLTQQRYDAALAASDSILVDIRSTNWPTKLYEDYDERSPWFFNLRDIALERVGRWDDAVAQLSESTDGNQLINLAQLYCDLGRTKDALSTIDRVGARASALGTMHIEMVRLEAALQLGNSKEVARSLEYLRVHRANYPPLICMR